MQHFRSLEKVSLNHAWLTIGVFDGVHRGHQTLIRNLTAGAHADGAPAVVLTFDPHPAAVLRPEQAPPTLTTPEERGALFAALGVDYVITHPFNHQVAALSAKDFLSRLKQHLGFQQFWVGHDFAMGHNREGDIPRLRELSAELGFQLHVVAPVSLDERPVSSSRIRALLAQGEVQQAAEMLGRPYQLIGEVIEGAGRGRTIGVPTANLAIPPNRALPARGVYACRAWVGDSRVEAVTNIGYRPTFDNGPAHPSVETHLLDFSGDLYGQVIRLEFLSRLREERKFPHINALVQQIQNDIVQAREILARPQP